MSLFRGAAGPRLRSLFEADLGELQTCLTELLERLRKSEENRSPVPEKA
jgi:hypothetical protein